MPISTACKCGNRFTAKDEFAGKTVKCPKCGDPLTIAADGGQPSSSGVDDLLDEVGVVRSKTGRRCPHCNADMKADDILCVQCGHNSETGKRVKTKVEIKKKSRIGPYSVSGMASSKNDVDEDLPPQAAALVRLLNTLGAVALIAAVICAVLVLSLAEIIEDSTGFALPSSLLVFILVFSLILLVPCLVAANLVRKKNEIGRIVSIVAGILGVPALLIGALILTKALSPEVKDFCKKGY